MRKERGEPDETFVREAKEKTVLKSRGQMSRTAESSSRERTTVSNDEKSANQLGEGAAEEGLLFYLGVLEELALTRLLEELEMLSHYESETSRGGQGKWGIMWVKGNDANTQPALR